MATKKTNKKMIDETELFNNPQESDEYFDDSQVKRWVIDEKFMNEFVREVNRRNRKKKEEEKGYQRQTFVITKTLLERLKNYCHENRVTQRDVLENALIKYLDEAEKK